MLVFMGFVDCLDKEKYRLSEFTKVGGNTSVDSCSYFCKRNVSSFFLIKRNSCLFFGVFFGGVKCVKCGRGTQGKPFGRPCQKNVSNEKNLCFSGCLVVEELTITNLTTGQTTSVRPLEDAEIIGGISPQKDVPFIRTGFQSSTWLPRNTFMYMLLLQVCIHWRMCIVGKLHIHYPSDQAVFNSVLACPAVTAYSTL